MDNLGGGRVIVLGVDPSFTATAVCRLAPAGDGYAPTFTTSSTSAAAGTLATHDRMRVQVSFVEEWSVRADVTIMEGPSFSSKGSATRDLAGLWWLMFDRLRRNGLPLGIVAPSVLKKWITGRGTADKFAVGQAVVRRWPGVELRSHDEADALALGSIGLHALDRLPWTPTAFQVEQLERVEWITWVGER